MSFSQSKMQRNLWTCVCTEGYVTHSHSAEIRVLRACLLLSFKNDFDKKLVIHHRINVDNSQWRTFIFLFQSCSIRSVLVCFTLDLFFYSHRSHELYLQSNCKMSFHYECSVIENSSSEIGKRETSDFRVFYFSLLKKLHVVCKCSETHSPNWSRLCICRTLFEFSSFFSSFFSQYFWRPIFCSCL